MIVFTPCEFFTPALADGLSLESEWQQVSPGLQDPSKYSGWAYQCFNLNGVGSSYDFQLFKQAFMDCFMWSNYN